MIHAGARSRQLAFMALAFMALALCEATIALCASCERAPRGSLGLVDPAFAYLYPPASAAFGSVACEVVILPSEEPQAALYAAVDAAKPSVLYLSPLLGAEIGPLLDRDDEARVAYLGPACPTTHTRLYAAVFSSDDAARLGASELAAELFNLTSQGADASVVALFSGPVAGSEAPEAFRTAFEASGAKGRLTLERAPQGFSQTLAESLRRLDVRAAYVSAPASELERWATQAFDDYVIIAAEAPLAEPEPPSCIDILLCWDVEASLGALSELVDLPDGSQIAGSWKTVRAKE